MKFPSHLLTGSTIGMVAPSFGCNIEPYKSAFANALHVLQEKGYQTKLGPNVYKGDGIGISTNAKDCASELMEAYLDPSIDAIISCGGGELMCEILNHMDFDAIASADPKWFMGYSDNSNFGFLLTTLCDTASIYGPNAPAFGMKPWHPSIDDAYRALTEDTTVFTVGGYRAYEAESLKDEEHPLAPYNTTERCVRVGYPAEKLSIEGRLLGGCLDILVNLQGTRFDRVSDFLEKYKEDGIVWFIEACDLNIMAIRRAIWQMDAAGWFRYTKGLLVGRPYHHKEVEFGLDQYHAVTDLLAKYDFPIIMDLDIGHIPPMMPLINGSYARANLDGNQFSISMELRE